jgi:CDP-diacylglycerol--glycerol-3-phosphate 3-phosphatidyltransferase
MTLNKQSTRTIRFIIPTTVSALRVLAAIVLITEINKSPRVMFLAAVVGVPLIFILDAVDGILARFLNSQTLFGSFFDIAADRAVEFIFLQYFANIGLLPLWFIIGFYGRILFTDGCRVRAFRMNKVTAVGIVLPERWSSLVLSKLSRSAYAALKAILFSWLLLAMSLQHASHSFLEQLIMLAVLSFSILRAAPILLTYFPRLSDLIDRKAEILNQSNVSESRSIKLFLSVQMAYDFFLAGVVFVMALR